MGCCESNPVQPLQAPLPTPKIANSLKQPEGIAIVTTNIYLESDFSNHFLRGPNDR